MTKTQQVKILSMRFRRIATALAAWAALGLGLVAAPSAKAQIFTTLLTFGDGTNPYAGLVQGSDGNFYGTTESGGVNGSSGTVFKMTPGGTLTTLYQFCSQGGNYCTDGANPYAGLVQGSDGNFYGTTVAGGTGCDGDGTVFKITPSGALTTIYSFCRANGNGYRPYSGLVQGSDGNFYGTTFYGSTVFKITPDGIVTRLYTFCSQQNCTDGDFASAGLVQGSDGNFYGTTTQGGDYGVGTAFKITPSGALTTLQSFNGTYGAAPYAGLVQGTDGNFYGTTSSGGANGNYGTVFIITPNGALTTLYSFCSQAGCTDGQNPYAAGLVQGTDGNFYGTTENGGITACNQGSGCGTIFKITPSGALTTLYSFGSQGDGLFPLAGVVQGTDGNFYGNTLNGGADNSNHGTVFALSGPGKLPIANVSPSSLTFGNQAVGTTSPPQTVTLSNIGTSPLTVSNIAASGDFAEANTCGSFLAAGGSCSIKVTFTPTTTGTRNGTLTVTDNSNGVDGSQQTVSLTGTGVSVGVSLSPTSLTFGNQVVNTMSSPKTVTMKSTGTMPLNITNIAASGDFPQTNNCPGSLAPGAKCTISVTFTPAMTGKRIGSITVTDNASNSPQNVPLSGTGVLPVVLSPSSLSFGTQAIATTSAAKAVTMTNDLNSAVTITSIVASGDFPETDNCDGSLPAMSKCTIAVTFTPTRTGTRTGTLTVTDSASNSP